MSEYSGTGCDKVRSLIRVRTIAQIRVGIHTIRILYNDEHSANTTIREVVDSVNGQLEVHRSKFTVTLLSNYKPLTSTITTSSSDGLLEKRISDVILDTSASLGMVCNYEGPKFLDRFIHAVSIRPIDEETTSHLNILPILIANIETILPDSHGRGKTFTEDVKRLANALGAEAYPFIHSILPHLIRIVEHAGKGGRGCCNYGIEEEKKAAGELLQFFLKDYSGYLTPYSLLLESLVIRLLSFANDDAFTNAKWGWAAEFLPQLLQELQREGLAGARPLWTAAWSALRDEIDGSTSEFITSYRAAIFIDSGITPSELNEIGTMLKKELTKCKLRMRDSESVGYKKADESILKSVTDLVHTGFEVMGDRFFSEVRPLLPLLCALIEKWDWGVSMIDDLSRRAPELIVSPRHSLKTAVLSDDRPVTVIPSEKPPQRLLPEESIKSSPVKPAIQMIMEYDEFRSLFIEYESRMTEKNREKRNESEIRYKAVHSYLKASFLWRMHKEDGEEIEKLIKTKRKRTNRCLGALSHAITKESLVAWNEEKLNEFCANLLSAVQSEINPEIKEGLISTASTFAEALLYEDKTTGRSIQKWKEFEDFILESATSRDSSRIILALNLFKYSSDYLGDAKPLILPLFETALGHEDESVRLAALTAFNYFACPEEPKLNCFSPLLPIIIKIAKSASGSELAEALRSVINCSSQSIDFLRPHLNELFDASTEFIASSSSQLRACGLQSIGKILGKRWNKLIPIVTMKRIDGLCNSLLKIAREETNYEVIWPLNELIVEVVQSRSEAKCEWPEFLLLMADANTSRNKRLKGIALDLIVLAPKIIIGVDQSTIRHVKTLLEWAGRDEQLGYDAWKAFEVLSWESEKSGDERVCEMISSIIPVFIKMAERELKKEITNADGYRDVPLYKLALMVDREMMQPHLPVILELCQSALTQKTHHKWAIDEIRCLKHKIASTKINIYCASLADKSAFVSSIEYPDEGMTCDDEINLDDELFGKKPLLEASVKEDTNSCATREE